MKVPELESGFTVVFLIGVPVVRATWVVMWNEVARTSFEVGSSLFFSLALPPLFCGFILFWTIDKGARLFQTLRKKNASLKTLTVVAVVTSLLAGPMLIILGGSYFGKVPEIFLTSSKEDWQLFLNVAPAFSALFFAAFAAGIYEERADRKNRE